MNEQKKQNSENREAPSDATEAGYLTNQANEAAAALSQALAALKQDLVKGVDPKVLAKQYPWAAVGAAAVAGFVTASAVVPSKEQQALKKLERIERALHPYPPGREHAVPVDGAGASAHQGRSMMGRLASELFTALKPALSSALAAYAASPSNDGDQEHNSKGHTASSAAAANAVYYQQDEEQRKQDPAA